MPEKTPFSQFDPSLVATYETQWWIAHNEKNKLALVDNLTKQHQELFGLPEEKASEAVTFFFQAVRMHDQRNWSAAIAFATSYYQTIGEHFPFLADPQQLAQAEINWWIKHDELEFDEDKTALTEAFAVLYSQLFGIELNEMREIAQQKTAATHQHDLAEKPEVTPEQATLHWQKVEQYLLSFYTQIKSKI